VVATASSSAAAAHAHRHAMLMHVRRVAQCLGRIRIVVVVAPTPHLRRGHRRLGAGHRLQHALQCAGVHVHVLGALGLPPGVVVDYVMLVHVVRVRVACLWVKSGGDRWCMSGLARWVHTEKGGLKAAFSSY